MMNFSKGARGVISVFLILILVPTMLFSALLVDGSRMASARAITQEAADLAALSVLSDYNSALKEEFGLFALEDASQAEEIFKESLSATLQASGLEEETYSEQVWEILKGAMGAGSPYQGKSFLNLYDFQLEETSVTPLYTLANPEVLQNQIVEYSKYRGLYVISERLGLLDHLGEIAEEAKDQEKSGDAMQERMKIDEKNGKYADKEIGKARERVDALNQKLENLGGQRSQYFSHLDAQMAVLAGVEDISRETRRMAEDYPDEKSRAQDYFSELQKLADRLDQQLPKARTEAEKAASRLNQFVSKYAGDSSETVRELAQDAKKSAEAYTKCVRELDALREDQTLRTLADQRSAERTGGVIENIDTAVHQFGQEQDEEDEEEKYKFYYYESNQTSEDSKDVKPGYEDAWKEALLLEDTAQVPEVHSSSYHYSGGDYQEGDESSGRDMREKAKQQSGTNAQNESMKNSSELKSLDPGVYQALPSKTFQAQAEADSYRAVLEEDLKKSVAPAGVFQDEAYVPQSTNVDFYNENGDLGGASAVLDGGKNSFLGQLGNLAENARDEVLTISYIFGNFKTRMTGGEKFKKGAVSKEKLDEFYMVPWRYLYEDGEQDLQFEAKSSRKTKLNAEIEYLIYGMSSDAANEAAAYASIYAPRMANNMLALYQNTTVKTSCNAAAAAASGLTLGIVPAPVFFWIFLTAWTVAETVLDMHYLVNEGYRIPLFKTKDTVLLTLDFSAGASEGLVKNYKKSSGSSRNFYVCYEDYLLFLLLLKSSDTRLMRTADLIEMGMQEQESSFQIDQAYTYIRARSGLSIRYLFMDTAPLEQGYKDAGRSGRMNFESVIYQGY